MKNQYEENQNIYPFYIIYKKLYIFLNILILLSVIIEYK
jgi:hypothetical protein